MPSVADQDLGGLLARRIILEGFLLTLGQPDVKDGTIISIHRLCESTDARRPLRLNIGGQLASRSQVDAAIVRVIGEIAKIDGLIEAKTEKSSTDLSMERAGSDPDPRVVHLQNRLNSLGHRVLPDGIFGPITEESVKDFQTNAGLPPTGVVDPFTADSLRRGGKSFVDAAPGLVGQPGRPIPEGNQPAETSSGDDTVAREKAQGPGSEEKQADTKTAKKGKSVSVNVKLAEAREQLAYASTGTEQQVLRARIDALAPYATLEERFFSAGKRKDLVKSGHALHEDGKDVFPIENAHDVQNAAGLWKSGHHQTPAAKAHISKEAKRLGVDDPFGMQEAKPDWHNMPHDAAEKGACPKCGAKIGKSGVCQRGHRVLSKVAHAHSVGATGWWFPDKTGK